MDKEENRLLIKQAVKLTTLGMKVERERGKIRKFVERGIAYSAPEMLAALERFQKADTEWKQLEIEHLSLKKEIEKQGSKRE